MPERPVGPADQKLALAELRAARRRKRVADIHWIDALYQVYLAALVSLVAVLLAGAGAEAVAPLTAPAAGLFLERVMYAGDAWPSPIVAAVPVR